MTIAKRFPSFRWFFAAFLFTWALLGAEAARSQVSVTTYHYDNSRTGQNTQETILTPANVVAGSFGKLFSVPVDGAIYAQPLTLTNMTINGGVHNVVYVATEHDSVYAIDSDNGTILWQVSFINPAAGITTVPDIDVNCNNIAPEMGITGTPVIDSVARVMYLVAKTKENGSYVQRLHALNVATGAEMLGGPVIVSASVSGTAADNSNSVVNFDPLWENQRSALLLENNHVVISWASHCDNGAYHGWVMSYGAGTLTQEAVLNTTPNGGLAGVWMGGDGIASDSAGNLFLATGNGDYNGGPEWGDTVMQLVGPSAGTFAVPNWFTPYDESLLDNDDLDQGSGGVVLLPDQPAGSPFQHLMINVGKDGTIYLLNRDNLGGFNASNNSQVLQSMPGATPAYFGTPAWWNNTAYFAGLKDNVKAFPFDPSTGMLDFLSSESPEQFGFPGAGLTVSANGTTTGIVWAIESDAYWDLGPAVLHAYDATNLASELYDSQYVASDNPGIAVKFTVPTVANGRVFVGTQTQLSVFGEFSGSPLEGISVSPSPVNGGSAATGTVTLQSAAPASGLTVALLSSNPAIVTVPPTVTIAGGSTSGTFPVTTSTVSASTPVMISAICDGTQSTNLTVNFVPGVGFQIAPGTANLNDSQSQQFSATLNGVADTAVSWTVTPPVGTISPSGLYTAPANILDLQTVTIAATTTTGATQSASSAVTLTPPSGTFTPIRVIAGGGAYTDSLGQYWRADTNYSGGTADTLVAPILNTNDPPLYQSERNGTFSYSFSVPAGNYTVTLNFCEFYWTAVGQRVFNVAINGNTVLSNFDIFAQAGGQDLPLQKTFTINASGGNITINFIPGAADKPKVSSIQIEATTPSGVSIQVNPTSATLGGGQTQQFSAQVTGSPNTAATWSMNPQVGTLDQTGLYTAPETISTQQTVIVTANAVADTTQHSSATVTLNPPITSFTPIRVNAGGPAYTDSLGNLWSADEDYSAGSTYTTSAGIGNTNDPKLYQSERSGSFNYTFAVPNGNYSVTLKFAEIWWTSVGQRTFNVAINGSTVLSNFDIVAAAGGPNLAIDKTFPVNASSGNITIQFIPGTANLPKISAIQILASPAASGVGIQINPTSVSLGVSQTQQFTATVTSSTNTAVTWSMNPQIGTLSTAGLYTAPTSITTTQTVTVTATAVADITQQASATVTLTPAASSFTPIRVNAGGPAYVDSLSQTWSGDEDYTGGNVYTTTANIGDTNDPKLYQSERYGNVSYNFAVPDGNYNVTLKFAEIYWTSPGQRIFSVAINGTTVLSNFDIVAAAGGPNLAIDETFPVSVSTGTITIQLIFGPEDQPKISAMQIVAAPPSGVSIQVNPTTANLGPAQTQQFAATVTGSTNTAVIWSMNPLVGTLDQTGLYTAPSTISTQQTVTVTAAASAEPSQQASATVTLTPPATTVGVQINPTTVSLAASQTQQFGATVTGSSNTAVSWSRNPQVGTLTTSGLYTAPASIATQQTVTVTATSVANNAVQSTATVTLTPPEAVGIQIGPTTASLSASQTQQFSATVTGSSNTAVTWTMNPQVGTLSTSGLYTAPVTIATQQAVIVTATAAADTTQQSSATVTLTPPVVTNFTPIRVDVGGPAYSDSLGQLWSADTNYTGGSTYTTSAGIGNTNDPKLYQSERSGSFSYSFAVPTGSYAVTLKFAEIWWTEPGQRIFNVAINGSTVLSNFDIVAEAGGPNLALDKTFAINAGTGTITIQFIPGTANLPKVSAIQIVASSSAGVGIQVTPTTASLVASQTQQFTATVTGSTNTGVTWSVSPQVGTLTQTGLFTAPATVAAEQTVIVTATAVADTTQQANATVTLTPPAAAFTPIRVNSGGPAYTDSLGNPWGADNNFTGGSVYVTSSSIGNTNDPTLYQSERYGSFSYTFAVPDGSYTVTLKFAEIFWTERGQRMFNVAINGTTVLSNFDILAAAGGPDLALDEPFTVNASTGTITIQFIPGPADNPKISAIQIIPVAP